MTGPQQSPRTFLGKPSAAWRGLASQLLRYGIFGGTGALTDFLVFTTLVRGAQLSPIVANVLSVLSGIAVSFLLNRRFTFDQRDQPFRRALKFLSVGLAGLGLSTSLIWLLTGPAHWAPLMSKLVSIPLVVGFQFAANRQWTFRRRA